MATYGKQIPDLPRLDGWFTMTETAEILQVTHGRIWQLMMEGKFGQAYRIGPHIILQRLAVEREYKRRLSLPRYAGLLKNRELLEQDAATPQEFDRTLAMAADVLTGKVG